MKIRINFSIVALLVSLLFGYTVQATQYIAYSLKVAQQRIENAGLDWQKKEPEVFNLAQINHIDGFVYDKESGDLILVGQNEEGRAPLTLDDLVVALRARFRNHEWPLVSIDPTKDTKKTKMQKVRFEGGIRETAFGQSLFDADYQLEQMAMGLVEPGIPGLKTVWDRAIENLEKGARPGSINSRLWFYPINPHVVVREGVCVVRGLKVGVFTEVLSAEINGEEVKDLKGFKSEETEAFASDVSGHFDDLCRVQPSFNRLRGLQELVAVSKALEELDEKVNLLWWLQKYPLTNVKTPKEVKVLERRNDRYRFEVSGGVCLTALAMRLNAGDVRALRDAVIKVRPSLKELSWRFMSAGWLIPLTPGQVKPEDIAPLFQQALWLYSQKRYNDALALWDKILGMHCDTEILFCKAETLYKLNNLQEAIAVYDEIEKRYGQSTEHGIQEAVVRAMLNKGVAVGKVKGPEAAIAIYDEVDKRYGQSTEAGIQEQVAKAVFNKGVALGELKGPEAEIAIFDEIEKRYGQSTEPGIQDVVASAMLNKGLALGELKGPQAAIAIYDEIEKRYGQSTEPGIQEAVASAMYNKGVALGELKGPQAAIAIYDEIEKRYGQSTEPGIQVTVANAMYIKGVALVELKGPEAAIAIFDEIEKRYGQSTEPRIQEKVAKAMINKGRAVGKVKGPEAEIAIYDEIEKRYGQSTETGIQEQVALAMNNKGVALGELKGPEVAIAIYDEIDKRYGQSTETGIQEQVALAMFGKGLAVAKVKGPEAAIAIYDEIDKRYGQSTEPGIQEQVALAMYNKGVALYGLKRYDEARKTLEKADKLGYPDARRVLEIMKSQGK